MCKNHATFGAYELPLMHDSELSLQEHATGAGQAVSGVLVPVAEIDRLWMEA
jgi:hypothetical protein